MSYPPDIFALRAVTRAVLKFFGPTGKEIPGDDGHVWFRDAARECIREEMNLTLSLPVEERVAAWHACHELLVLLDDEEARAIERRRDREARAAVERAKGEGL